MKVLLVATVQSHICQFHKPLAAMLHKNGAEVHVAARNNLAEKNGLTLDFADKVFDVPFSRSPKSADNIKAYKQLKKIIDEENYDVVHCNTPMGGIVARLAARKARKKGTKVYYTAHGFHFYKGAPKKYWAVFYPIEKFFARFFTDKLITINNDDYKLALKKFKTKVFRIHGVGIDPERYLPYEKSVCDDIRKKMSFSQKDIIVLCVGELNTNKNQAMLIKAVSKALEQNSNIKLLLAGNGPNKDNLEAIISELNLTDYVKLLGYCTDLEKYQNITDISVSCSIREGLGLNVIEAMLTKKPVIGTINRGHCELIEESVNGFLVPIGDSEALAEKLLLLANNSDIRNIMGEIGFDYAQSYTYSYVTHELEKIYFN